MSKPVHPEFKPRLLSARDVVPGVRLFRFASWPGFSFLPGQFVMLHFADDPKTWRAYSVCSAPRDGKEFFELAIGMVGPFSDRLGALTPGGEHGLVARGPFGKWTWDGSGHAVMISGGTGITPFRAMALLGKGKATLWYSAKTGTDQLFRDEYDAWRAAGVEVNVRSTREGGSRLAASEIAAGDRPEKSYYICGPKGLVEDMRGGLASAGIAPERIRTEKWGDYTDLF